MTHPSLFDIVDVPDVRTEAPAAPGSASSHRAAQSVSDPFRRATWKRIMLALGSVVGPISMHDVSVRADVPINVCCARIPELEPLWIARSKDACRSHVKPSLAVDGFSLTAAGRGRVSRT